MNASRVQNATGDGGHDTQARTLSSLPYPVTIKFSF